MTLLNPENTAIADRVLRVTDALTECEDTNLYRQQGDTAVVAEQLILAELVRTQRKEAATMQAAQRLVELAKRRERKRQVRGRVVDLAGRRVA
jgi:predicted nucleic acid-binding protein